MKDILSNCHLAMRTTITYPDGRATKRNSMISGLGLFIARAWSQIAATVLFVFAARLLTHDDVGIFALASAMTMVFTQWVGVGTYEYIIRERQDPDAEHTAFWLNVVAALVLGLIGAGVALGAGTWFKSPSLTPVMLALAPLTLPAGCRSVAEAIMVRNGQLKGLAFSMALVELISLCAGMLALFNGMGLWSLVVHKWFQTAGAALVFWVVAKWLPKARFDGGVARKMGHFGLGIFGDRFLGYFQSYGVDIFLGALLSPSAVALYRVGARLVTAGVTVITEPLRQLNWKLLSDAAHEGRSVPHTAERSIGIMFGLMAGPMIGLVVTADLAVNLLLGSKWESSTPIVQVLALAALVSTPQLLTESALGVQSKTRWLPAVRAGAVATLFVMLVLLGRHGAGGAAWGQLIAAVVLSVASIAVQWRLIGIRPRGYIADLLVYGAAAGAMALTAIAWRALAAHYHWSNVPTLAGCVLFGGCAYVGVAGLLRGAEIKNVFADVRMARNTVD
jgi:O-antigen/teichoic acid export membrane protein